MDVDFAANPFYMTVNQSTNLPIGGFNYDLQKVIASKGEITFNYVLVSNKPTYLPWSSRLKKVLRHVDIYGNDLWSDTVDRRQNGLGFPYGVQDKSLVLITQINLEKKSNVWGFFLPFDSGLWFAILALVLFNGIVLWVVNISPGERESLGSFAVVKHVYKSFMTFTTSTDLG